MKKKCSRYFPDDYYREKGLDAIDVRALALIYSRCRTCQDELRCRKPESRIGLGQKPNKERR